MTFYYVEEDNTLEGNRASEYAVFDGETLVMDVDEMQRGLGKLQEMRHAIDQAIEANK